MRGEGRGKWEGFSGSFARLRRLVFVANGLMDQVRIAGWV